MSENTKVKLHSDVAIEVIGKNQKPKVNLDKDGKVASVESKWQANKKNRVALKKGVNMVEVECLDWPMIKALEERNQITIDRSSLKSAKTAAKKEEKAAPVKEEKAEEETPKTKKKAASDAK